MASSSLWPRDVTIFAVAMSLLLYTTVVALLDTHDDSSRRAVDHRQQLSDDTSSSSSSPDFFDVVVGRSSHVRRIRAATILSCPKLCTCLAAGSLYCTISPAFNCAMTSLPTNMTGLRLKRWVGQLVPPPEIDADCDDGTSTAVKSTHFPRLAHLDVSGNSIGDEDWLLYLTLFRRIRSSSLVSLDVADNRLERLTNATFATYANFATLETLNISDNRIDRIDSESFFGLSRLRVLVLSGNSVKRIDPGTFDLLPQLKILNLSRNTLTSVNLADLLSSLAELDVLSLTGNNLRRIFTDHTRIRPTVHPVNPGTRHRMSVVDLSDNELREWPFHVWPSDEDDDGFDVSGFQPLDIQFLRIDGNPIKMLLSLSGGISNRYRKRKLINAIGAVKELSISRMPELVAVDVSVFEDLMTSPEALETVLIHDNPRLRYVDRSIEDKLQSLRNVYLHNNNLTAVTKRVASGLRSLTLYGNPFTCDCHLSWLRSSFNPRTYHDGLLISATDGTILNANESVCPQSITSLENWIESVRLLEGTSPEPICLPVVIPLFDGTILQPLGSDLILDCRVVDGDDTSGARSQTTFIENVIWTTPDIVDRDRRVDIARPHPDMDGGSVLTVRRLRARDAGLYRCRLPTLVDFNSSGNTTSIIQQPYAQAQVVLKLYNVAAGVLPVSIGSRSVTIMWNGTESTLSTADYVVIYRPLPTSTSSPNEQAGQEVNDDEEQPCSGVGNLNFVNELSSTDRWQQRGSDDCYVTSDSGAILIRPFLRKYTVNGLRPNTIYEFCMTSRIGRGGRLDLRQRPPATTATSNDGLVRLVCVNVTTRPEMLTVDGVSLSLFSGTLLSVVCVSIVVMLACVLLRVARRHYSSRKWYTEPEMIFETSARGESLSVRLTSGFRRGPMSVARYGLPLTDLRLVDENGTSSKSKNKFDDRRNSIEFVVENSPLSTSKTSLVGFS